MTEISLWSAIHIVGEYARSYLFLVESDRVDAVVEYKDVKSALGLAGGRFDISRVVNHGFGDLAALRDNEGNPLAILKAKSNGG